MDVRCGRCGTDYEFDDALISERGTTVKCTNCGYQFRVFPNAPASTPERWLVKTLAGRELVYTTLRDLQRGIAKGHVGPDDLLTRGDRAARPLASIPELEPFLRSQDPSLYRNPRTLQGVPPAISYTQGGDEPASFSDPGLAAPASGDAGATIQTLPGPYSSPPAANPNDPSLVPTGTVDPNPQLATNGLAQPYASLPGPSSTLPLESESPPTIPLDFEHPVPSAGVRETPSALDVEHDFFANRESETALDDSGRISDPNAVRDFDAARELLRHDEETDPRYVGIERRHARSRWLVFVVVLAAGGLLAATVGKRYLAKYTTPAKMTAPEADARITELLAAGQRHLLEGDLEASRESVTKASALGEKDPRVLAASARLDVLGADLAWLKLRLLDPTDQRSVEQTKKDLDKRVGRAAQSVAAAARVAPDEPATQRLIVHARRLEGKLPEARGMVSAVSKNASLPDNAYALAALDMAEPSPSWAGIVLRLRTAATEADGLERARIALVYALARSGQLGPAEGELEKLVKHRPSHPLIFDLKEFLKRSKAGAVSPSGSAALEALGASASAALDPNDETASDAEASGDFRSDLKRAHRAAENGQLGTAERLYRSVLARQPDNTEALSGLAEVAAKRNDPRASELYARVLEKNPSYLPAQMASADQMWSSGNKSGALKLYRRVLDHAGADSSYGRRALGRIHEAEAERRKEAEAPATGSEPSPETRDSTDTESERDTEVPIDRTDLPEYDR